MDRVDEWPVLQPRSIPSAFQGRTKREEYRVIEQGQLVANRYRLLESIGSGAMGIVWRAKDERLERVVAIKQLLVRPDLTAAQTDEARRRAMREARIAARLHHRNAIAMLDVAEHNGDPCLIMEFLPSRSLSAVLAERGTLPPDQVAAIGSQVAAALAAAHAAGIVHRDVKPGNILLDDKGTVKITDFGISRAVDDGTVTETGMLAGTPAYLAPEIARGHDPGAASDVFSLGATLYHAVEGVPPFGLNTNPLALLHAVASGKVAPPKNAGPLTPALMSLLRVDPQDRPTMVEAASTLAVPTAPLQAQTPKFTEPRTVPARQPASMTMVAPVPQRSAPARPEPPRTAPAAPQPPPGQPKRGVLIAALLGVLILAGAVTMVIANSGRPTAGPKETTTVTQSASPQPPSAAPSTQPVAATERVTNYSEAGGRVIAFYGSDTPAATRWKMLGPNGQGAFGDQAAFADYWGKFVYVSSRQARVAKENPDGSVTVTVEVTTKDSAGESKEPKSVTVILQGGQYLIDSDSR